MPLTVLVADSDSWFRDLVWRVLEDTARVREAASPQEAVALTRAFWPDVALLGIEMHLDDPGTIKRLKAAFPPMRVILMTGHGEEAYLDSTGKTGADALLPKHRVRRELVQTIRKLTGQAARPWDGNDRRRPAWVPTPTRYLGPNRRLSRTSRTSR